MEIPADGDSGRVLAVGLDLPTPDRVRGVAVVGAGSIGEDTPLRVVLLHLRPALPAGAHGLDLHDPFRVVPYDVGSLDDLGDDRVPFREAIDVGEEREDLIGRLGHTLCDAPGPPHRTAMIPPIRDPSRARATRLPAVRCPTGNAEGPTPIRRRTGRVARAGRAARRRCPP